MKAVRQKIAFLAPFYELAETVGKVAEEQDENIVVFMGCNAIFLRHAR